MDFINVLKADIESKAYTPAVVEIGTFNEDGEAVAIRVSPSNINERYMQKGKNYPFSFQLLIHYASNFQAYSVAQKLVDDYDGATHLTSSDGSYTLTSLYVTTTPNFVEKTDNGSLYTMMCEAELYIGG